MKLPGLKYDNEAELKQTIKEFRFTLVEKEEE